MCVYALIHFLIYQSDCSFGLICVRVHDPPHFQSHHLNALIVDIVYCE